MKLKITVDGKTYEVDVEVAEEAGGGRGPAPYYAPPRPVTAAPARPEATGARPASAPAGGVAVAEEEKVCRSPLAGLVVRINTHPGQQIHQNDPLMVLEAMKMETNVTSPITGVVREVNAAVGDSVRVGQVLVEFE